MTNLQETENRISEFRRKFPLSFVNGLSVGIAGGIASGAAKGYFTQKFKSPPKNDTHNKSNKGGGAAGTSSEAEDAFWNRIDEQVRNGRKEGKFPSTAELVDQELAREKNFWRLPTKQQTIPSVWNKYVPAITVPAITTLPGLLTIL